MTNGNKDDPVDKIDRLFDAVEKMRDVYENNKDLVGNIGEDGDTITLDDKEPLTEAHLTDDEVVVVADVNKSAPLEMAVGFKENSILFDVDGKEFEVDVPADVKEESLDASIKNGVLRVELDRADDGPVEITDIESIDMKEEEEEDDNGTSE